MNMTYTLEQVKEACGKATPGPWKGSFPLQDQTWILIGTKLCTDNIARVSKLEDAEFIALARTALPELVARVRELEGETDPYWMNKARELEAENSVLRKALFKFARELCDLADQVLAVTEQSEGGVANG